jgi:hypothetical protein
VRGIAAETMDMVYEAMGLYGPQLLKSYALPLSHTPARPLHLLLPAEEDRDAPAQVQIHSDRFPSGASIPSTSAAMDEPRSWSSGRPVVFLGENGSGKSTLLEAIARKCEINLWDRPRRHVAHNNPFETSSRTM